NRGVISQITSAEGTKLVSNLPGLEWVEVPNPIIVTPAQGNPGDPGYIPPVMDDRHAYLVKFANENQDDQQSGIDQGSSDPADPNYKNLLQRTKLGQWVLNNSVRDDQDVNGTIVPAWRIGTNTWAMLDDQGLMGQWL